MKPQKKYELLDVDQLIAGAINRHAPVCGIYFLLHGPFVVYVGQSRSVHRRIGDHVRNRKMKWDRYFLLPCDVRELVALESRYIQKYRPKYNASPRHDRSHLEEGDVSAKRWQEIKRGRRLQDQLAQNYLDTV